MARATDSRQCEDRPMAVMGVDGCKRGWVGVRWDGTTDVLVAATIAELVALAGPLEAVAIDTPIDLPADERRQAEQLARRLLPGRASTVFNAPAAAVMDAVDYPAANAANRVALGLGLSKQTWYLVPKIRDVRDWLATDPGVPVVEAHPEVCFAAMNGGVVVDGKTTAAGEAVRRSLLATHGLVVDARRATGLAVDDVLDAAATAWTARRYADGVAERHPPEPADRPSPAIWT
jgi:predicted RNase H-like nuclease